MRCSESFARLDPDTSSWKTSQLSLFGGSIEFSDRWPSSGSMRSGRCYRQPTAEHPTCDDDSGCWLPTPSATSYGSSNNGRRGDGSTFRLAGKPSLNTMAKSGNWIPTPTAGDAKSSGSQNLPGSKAHAGVSLTDFVRHGNSSTPRLPTPAARDHRHPNKKSTAERRPGAEKKGEQLPNAVGGPLNPTWVEWLMGFPIGWGDCAASGMHRFRSWLRGRSGC